jgi:hypothetical protein
MHSLDRLPSWVENFAIEATREPFAHWWGRCDPVLAGKRLVRAVRRLNSAAELGSLAPRIGDDVEAPSDVLPVGYAPMPESLTRLCVRLERLRKQGELTSDEQKAAWTFVRAYARTRKASAKLPKIAWLASKLLRRVERHPEAAAARRAS